MGLTARSRYRTGELKTAFTPLATGSRSLNGSAIATRSRDAGDSASYGFGTEQKDAGIGRDATDDASTSLANAGSIALLTQPGKQGGATLASVFDGEAVYR